MATDATGTPTSLGIPTYNVSVDAPSGLGFNAAMAAIDAIIIKHNGPMTLNNSTTPATPVAGGTVYVETGSLKFKGSSGTITVIAPA